MRNRFYAIILAALVLAGCGKSPEPAREAKVEKAPDLYQVKFETSKGPFVVEVRRDLAPFGADRFYDLV